MQVIKRVYVWEVTAYLIHVNFPFVEFFLTSDLLRLDRDKVIVSDTGNRGSGGSTQGQVTGSFLTCLEPDLHQHIGKTKQTSLIELQHTRPLS